MCEIVDEKTISLMNFLPISHFYDLNGILLEKQCFIQFILCLGSCCVWGWGVVFQILMFFFLRSYLFLIKSYRKPQWVLYSEGRKWVDASSCPLNLPLPLTLTCLKVSLGSDNRFGNWWSKPNLMFWEWQRFVRAHPWVPVKLGSVPLVPCSHQCPSSQPTLVSGCQSQLRSEGRDEDPWDLASPRTRFCASHSSPRCHRYCRWRYSTSAGQSGACARVLWVSLEIYKITIMRKMRKVPYGGPRRTKGDGVQYKKP